jgi:hypothetical protein
LSAGTFVAKSDPTINISRSSVAASEGSAVVRDRLRTTRPRTARVAFQQRP